jgi:hypothetical protein
MTHDDLTQKENEFLENLIGAKPVPMSDLVEELDCTGGDYPSYKQPKKSMSKRVK